MSHHNSTTDLRATLPGTFEGLLLVRAVQIAEEKHPLDDVLALRQAHAQFKTAQDRLIRRAILLAPQLGLDAELVHWRARIVWVCLICALWIVLLSYSLIGAVVGGDRSINAVGALAAVLGPHIVTLAFWILTLAFGSGSGGLPRMVLEVSTRVPGFNRPSSRLLLDAGQSVMGQSRRFSGWAFGTMMHAMWAVAFVIALLGLFAAFSFYSFRLTWETTILSTDVLASFATLTGGLPRLIGFPTPNVANVLSGEGDHRGWAIWLLGCTLVYGLGFRLLAGMVSGAMFWRALTRLQVDTKDPYIRKLLQRFEGLNAVTVLDVENPPGLQRPVDTSGPVSHTGWFVVGYELPSTTTWPPAWAGGCKHADQSDGSVASKRSLLESLKNASPRHLIIVCNISASPDRATERFIRDAARYAEATAVLLVTPAGQAGPISPDRWLEWLQPFQLDKIFINDAGMAVKWVDVSNG